MFKTRIGLQLSEPPSNIFLSLFLYSIGQIAGIAESGHNV